MPRTLVRIPAVLAVLWMGLAVPVTPGSPVATCDAAPAPDTVTTDLAAVDGGSVLICALTGILFGAAVMTGNPLAAGGAVVGAIQAGCLW